MHFALCTLHFALPPALCTLHAAHAHTLALTPPPDLPAPATRHSQHAHSGAEVSKRELYDAAKSHFEGVDGLDPTGALERTAKIPVFERETARTTKVASSRFFEFLVIVVAVVENLAHCCVHQ